MNKSLYMPILLGAIIGTFLVVPLGKFLIYQKIMGRTYVTGMYAEYCYVAGDENGNITKKFYYRTLELCGKPLRR